MVSDWQNITRERRSVMDHAGCGFCSGENLPEDFRAEDARLREAVRIEDDAIVLEGYYWIDLARCDTREKILDWVHHLSMKYWVDSRMLWRFMELAAERHGIDLDVGA